MTKRGKGTADTFGDDRTAALTNVALAMRALEKARNRPRHLPGMVGFYGHSGLGKSFAGAYAATHHNAYYVECRSTWTKKALLQAILKELGVKPADTISEMSDQAAQQLSLSDRAFIVDEFDTLVHKGAVELIRDIHDGSGGTPMLLIGEERLELNLRKHERFHNRVLEWVPALPASLDDARKLRTLYCTVQVADDLLERIVTINRGVVRRICVNLERVQEFASLEGLEKVGAEDWGQRSFYTGEAPRRVS